MCPFCVSLFFGEARPAFAVDIAVYWEMLPGEVICCLSCSVAPAMHKMWGSHSMGLPLALPLGALLGDDPCYQLVMGCTIAWSSPAPHHRWRQQRSWF